MSPSWRDNKNLPEFNMNEVRDIIFQWLSLLKERAKEEHADAYLMRIAPVVEDLKLAADKSSYLGRRFSGEIHRTNPCPIHKGKWSGLPLHGNECECQLTGWLPRVRPIKEG